MGLDGPPLLVGLLLLDLDRAELTTANRTSSSSRSRAGGPPPHRAAGAGAGAPRPCRREARWPLLAATDRAELPQEVVTANVRTISRRSTAPIYSLSPLSVSSGFELLGALAGGCRRKRILSNFGRR